jgi:hypothetical protein
LAALASTRPNNVSITGYAGDMASSLIHTTIFQGAVLVTATAARTTLDYRKYIHDSIWVNLATLSSG